MSRKENYMLKILVLVLVAVSVGYAFHAPAQSRIDTRPAVTPIPSSSSNGVSFVWFYDPAERIVYACRAGQGLADTVECKAKTTLH
jgi:hypothetical protein